MPDTAAPQACTGPIDHAAAHAAFAHHAEDAAPRPEELQSTDGSELMTKAPTAPTPNKRIVVGPACGEPEKPRSIGEQVKRAAGKAWSVVPHDPEPQPPNAVIGTRG